jgi:hypothetical protein
MSLAFLFHYLMLNMFRMLIHPSSGAYDLFVELVHVLYCSGKMCFGVKVLFGWGGVVWYPCSRLHPATRIPPQPSHTETPTHIETRTHYQCGDTIEKSQAPDDGCINVRNMLSNEEVK